MMIATILHEESHAIERDDATALSARLGRVAILPDPTALCCAVARSALEVLRGERSPAQLVRWVAPDVLDALSGAAGTRPATGALTIQRLRLVYPAPDVAEASVVVGEGQRIRAAAARLEAVSGMWRVVALEIG